MSEGRILFIDAYDSFANNIIALLKAELSVSVESIKIDDSRFVLNDDAFHEFLDGFDAVVAGPGPGHPGAPTDVGSIGKLWCVPDDHLIPGLGICLGFQSMALAFGGAIERLREPCHGIVTRVLHCGRDIFHTAGDIEATQYHSLHVTVGSSPECLSMEDLWIPAKSAKEIVPLAWDLSDEKNGPVLMSARHCHKPFWGVQFHPESICTNKAGGRLFSSWWKHACAWNAAHGRFRIGDRSSRSAKQAIPWTLDNPAQELSEDAVQWNRFELPVGMDIVDIANPFREDCDQYQPIILESGLRDGKPVNADTGRYSIIGLPDKETIHIRYSVAEHQLTISAATSTIASSNATVSKAFTFLESFVQKHKAIGGPAHVPFWGGLVGFASYEAGLESIDVQSTAAKNGRPDMWFVFVERSIVLEHSTGFVYVQSVRANDADWVESIGRRLSEFQGTDEDDSSSFVQAGIARDVVYGPSRDEYCSKVGRCQDHLRAGSSYELCLTDTTLVSNDTDPWQLYLRLRQINPAPFGAYFTACAKSADVEQVLHLLSSSPERFLSWSRDGKCQFRPIKGTVKKGPSMTRGKAEQILNSPKERAENLMIVDLIRHDLNGVVSAHNVEVPKLMLVEEYESVFQLVSVIEGDLSSSGIRVLAASLPPGSMTGAPKKRSCELLQVLESGRERGLYSGVFGYLDVGGGGDFSVVIRSAFKWDDEAWCIGAGGAVTALSDADAEWEEMLAKRENVLRAFS